MKREKVQAVLFTSDHGRIKFLLLHAIPLRGGFWQGVTGTVETGESTTEALHREVREETGIDRISFKRIIPDAYEFSFIDRRGDYVIEHVFGVELRSPIEVDLSRNIYEEHSDYRWLPLDEALELLRYDSEKRAFKSVAEKATSGER